MKSQRWRFGFWRNKTAPSKEPHLRPSFLVEQMLADCDAIYEVLITEMLFDDVEERLADAITRELVEEEEHGVIEPVGGVIGAMRGEQDVCQFVEGMTGGQRFFVENVESCTSDAVGRKRADHSQFVDHRAAAYINYDGGGFHGGKLGFGDHAVGFFG